MAVTGPPRAGRRVVGAPPDGILQTEASRVAQHERENSVSQRNALGTVGIGDHHIDRQPARVLRLRVRPHAVDVGDLGELRADGPGGQDGVGRQPRL